MTDASTREILERLKDISLSGDGKDIVAAGYVKAAERDDDTVRLVIELPGEPDEKAAEALQRACEKAVKKLKGVREVAVVVTAAREPASPKRPAPPSPKPIPGVKHAIAVAAGKGGVGKSTAAVNFSVALARLGYRVGLVDADIYGPSVARMLKLEGKPEIRNNKMVPPERYGIRAMSMALLLDEDAPAVWRGPMATKALAQLVLGADWGSLDFLIFDLPPGTGDIHLSLVQNFALSGAVVVAAPQEVALMDVRKAIGMFGKVHVPVLGVIGNMSHFTDPSGARHYLFGRDTVRRMAEELSLELLAEIPIDPLVSETSDSGEPLAATRPDHAIAKLFMETARKIVEKV